jgi:hypothetical protein
MGRIRVAARQALNATKGDATLAGAQRQVRALVTRARQLDVLRRACARRIARIDRAALARRADACARSTVPIAASVLASFEVETAAAAQLENDHRTALLELERIESVLRTVALRVAGGGRPATPLRLGPGAHAVADPVEALVSELDLRDEALAEADAS